MRARSVIGITAGPVAEDQPYGKINRFRVSADYVEAVLAAGGTPVVLPPQRGNDAELLELVDGLIFSGGADLDPALYGDTDVHPATYDVNELRDSFEIDLIQSAIERDLPILCICRGIQVLNVALGGTLYQHIPDQTRTELQHRQHEIGLTADQSSHRVDLAPGSLAERVFQTGTIETNSLHHQSVRIAGPGIQINGISKDGVIEAVSVPGCTFVLGVQWHPELLFKSNPTQLLPFTALIEAAVARQEALV